MYINTQNLEWNVKCACGCGGDVPKPNRIYKYRPLPRFIKEHWMNLKEYTDKTSDGNRKRKKIVPEIMPCIGRRGTEGKYYSRHLMEKHLGRILSADEQVHHLNDDKTDDRLENLVVVSRSLHRSIHNAKPNRDIELTCDGCGKKFIRKTYWYKGKESYCTKQCFYDSSIKRNLTPTEYNQYFRDKHKKISNLKYYTIKREV